MPGGKRSKSISSFVLCRTLLTFDQCERTQASRSPEEEEEQVISYSPVLRVNTRLVELCCEKLDRINSSDV